MPYKHTEAQMNETPYKWTVYIKIGNVLSEMNANMLLESMHSIDPSVRTCEIKNSSNTTESSMSKCWLKCENK